MNKKEPLIRLAKREDMPKKQIWLIRLGSVVVAMLLGCVILAIAGANPITAYGIMIKGALG
ncbi:MAG: ABC transporter permease, partial [Firmicutes bacterium]|nr:ABC transporter permease [Bacillota bacterium]